MIFVTVGSQKFQFNRLLKKIDELIENKVINEEVKDDDIQFVTITAVDISSDLSYAKVYFTNLIDKDREKVTKALNRASSFIRGKLFDKVEIRKMPELTFVYDESIEYGNKIEKIIDSINKEE